MEHPSDLLGKRFDSFCMSNLSPNFAIGALKVWKLSVVIDDVKRVEEVVPGVKSLDHDSRVQISGLSP
jgi:hypothetical protein